MKKLTIDDKNIVKPYLEYTQTLELGFGVMLAYMDNYCNFYEILGEYLSIFPRGEANSASDLLGAYSPESFQNAVDMVSDILGESFKITCVPQENITRYRRLNGYKIEKITRSYPDYLCKREDFLTLSWKTTKSKFSDYNSFTKKNKYTYYPLSANLNSACMEILNDWCNGRICNGCVFGCEKNPLRYMLNNQEKLNISGGVVFVGNMPAAFMVCEQNKDTVHIYAAKTNINLTGLTVYLYLETIKNEFLYADYVNMGTDEGIPGLIAFKNKFKPYTYVEKNTLYLHKI